MSVIKPEIDDLLEQTEHNPFLLCSVASYWLRRCLQRKTEEWR